MFDDRRIASRFAEEAKTFLCFIQLQRTVEPQNSPIPVVK